MAAMPQGRSFDSTPALLAEEYGVIPSRCHTLEQAVQVARQQDWALPPVYQGESIAPCRTPGSAVNPEATGSALARRLSGMMSRMHRGSVASPGKHEASSGNRQLR